jgi:hypothetical protein
VVHSLIGLSHENKAGWIKPTSRKATCYTRDLSESSGEHKNAATASGVQKTKVAAPEGTATLVSGNLLKLLSS